jgi:hypothetical protein
VFSGKKIHFAEFYANEGKLNSEKNPQGKVASAKKT